MKPPIPGFMILFRNPWESPFGLDLYSGGEIAFASPNGSLTLYGLGGRRVGWVRVSLTIGNQHWQDACLPTQIERTASRFFRAWERKNPHRYLVKPL